MTKLMIDIKEHEEVVSIGITHNTTKSTDRELALSYIFIDNIKCILDSMPNTYNSDNNNMGIV